MLEMALTVGFIALQSVVLLVSLLVLIAFLLLADRKVWAAVQMRRGPNVVGPYGLLQSFADLLKFVLKEAVIPDSANKGVFLIAPLVTCVLALASWAVIPTSSISRAWPRRRLRRPSLASPEEASCSRSASLRLATAGQEARPRRCSCRCSAWK